MRFAYYFSTYNLRFRSRASKNALNVLVYLQLADFQPELRECALRTAYVLTIRDIFASKESRKIERHHSESASTRSPSSRQIRTAPQRERFDTQYLRRQSASTRRISAEGLTKARRIRGGATARALRHAESPQRVCQAQDKFARRHSKNASTRAISAEGSPRARRIRTAPQRERSTRRISAEGSPRARRIRTAPKQKRFDTHALRRGFAESKTNSRGATARALDTQDLRRGFAESKTNSHGATARALRHAQSPQRVRRAHDKVARRHRESASTRTISAKGALSSCNACK